MRVLAAARWQQITINTHTHTYPHTHTLQATNQDRFDSRSKQTVCLILATTLQGGEADEATDEDKLSFYNRQKELAKERKALVSSKGVLQQRNAQLVSTLA